jgi:broad specificity phosphatase PhoE
MVVPASLIYWCTETKRRKNMRLLLVRHGESMGNITRSLQTRTEPLTERGQRQAREIAAHLARRGDVRTLYSSPLTRAMQTSQIIGEAIGVEPEPREALAEINVGTAAGMPFAEWTERFPEEAARFHSDGIHYTFPGGESGKQLGERVRHDLDQIIATHRHQEHAVVIVSHGGALSWILGHLRKDPYDAWPPYQFANCSVTEVLIEGDTDRPVTMVCQNEIGHLSPEPTEEVATGQA